MILFTIVYSVQAPKGQIEQYLPEGNEWHRLEKKGSQVALTATLSKDEFWDFACRFNLFRLTDDGRHPWTLRLSNNEDILATAYITARPDRPSLLNERNWMRIRKAVIRMIKNPPAHVAVKIQERRLMNRLAEAAR